MNAPMSAARTIPELSDPIWGEVGRLPIEDDGEPLVPLSLVPERIRVHPAYFLDGIPGAVPGCYARESVLERLLEAADRLPAGLRLVVLDGWRPHSVQKHLFETLHRLLRQENPDMAEEELARRTREFVAPPSRDPSAPSPHLTGGAVDVTLCDGHGRLLPMGSAFDEITARSHTRHLEDTGEEGTTAAANRRLLYQVMIGAGFTNLPTEWWHFDFGNQLWAWSRGEAHARYGVTGVVTLEARWSGQLGS